MRAVPWEKIRDAQRKFIQLAVPRAGLPFDFCPNTEPADSPEPMFMSQSPEQVLRSGNFSLVPIMIGTNGVRSRKLFELTLNIIFQVESKFFATEPAIDPEIFNKFAADEALFVPYSFGLNKTTQRAEIKEVADKFKSIYFNGATPSLSLMKEWLDFSTDGQFTFGVERTVRYYYNKSSTTPIYVYTFSFDGSANMVGKNFPGFKGACHTDVSKF